MKNIQRAIQNEIERRVRLESCRQNIKDWRTTSKIKRNMAELRKELRQLKNELAEVRKVVGGTAGPKRPITPRVNGAGILRLRKRNGLTEKEFADVLGVSLETVSRWENGKQVIRPAHKKAIADLRHIGKRVIRKMLAEKHQSVMEEKSSNAPAELPEAQPLSQTTER